MRAYGKITVVGLGSGHVEQMTLGVWRRIKHANHIYLRTAEHPIVTVLDEEQIRYESFDEVYRSHVDFASVYESITEMLIAEAVAGKDVLYGVPGHPAVAEQTVRLLRRRCRSQAIVYEEFGGESFLDQAYTKLGIDPIDGFQLYDASSFRREHIQPDVHTFITQVYDMITASDVKLTLMDVYPDEHVVTVAHRLGFANERIKQVPLYELDRLNDYGNWSFIWIPRSTDDSLKRRSFSRLHDIVHRLRSPDGCPWDREQTHQSIRKNLIEEMYEVLEAIDHDDHEALCEELGDVLLQVMLHSQMEAEMGTFTVYDVIQTLNDKLIRRH